MIGELPAPKYPSFNTRTIATVIDLFIIIVIALPVTNWLTALLFQPMDINSAMMVQQANPNAVTGHSPTLQPAVSIDYNMLIHLLNKNWPQIAFSNLMQLIFIAAYEIYFWIRFSATPGKMLFRMEIRNAANGERITPIQAVVRFIGYLFSGALLTLGFMYVLFNKKKRGLHDFIANTVVIKKMKATEPT